MKRAWSLLKALFGRQWLLATIAVLLGMGLLARLGFWQLDRLERRRAQNAALAAALASPPLVLNDMGWIDDLTALKDRAAMARGTFDFAFQGAVRLQTYQGRAGVNLVAPLVLDGGEETAVLVDRGWVPEENSYAAYDEAGPQTIDGYIALTQTINRGGASGAITDELEWYRVDIAAIQTQMPYELLPVFIKQAPDENNQQPPLRG